MATSAEPAAIDRDALTPAQWYCGLVGATLLIVGIVGFFVDSSFDTGANVQGDDLIVFEVNAWHNIVHILSGVVLLASAPNRVLASAVALLFGLVYGFTAVWGLIDGNDVFGLFPVNTADNVLHIALSAVGILAAMASDIAEPSRTTRPRRTEDEARFGRDVDPLTGAPREDPRRPPRRTTPR